LAPVGIDLLWELVKACAGRVSPTRSVRLEYPFELLVSCEESDYYCLVEIDRKRSALIAQLLWRSCLVPDQPSASLWRQEVVRPVSGRKLSPEYQQEFVGDLVAHIEHGFESGQQDRDIRNVYGLSHDLSGAILHRDAIEIGACKRRLEDCRALLSQEGHRDSRWVGSSLLWIDSLIVLADLSIEDAHRLVAQREKDIRVMLHQVGIAFNGERAGSPG